MNYKSSIAIENEVTVRVKQFYEIFGEQIERASNRYEEAMSAEFELKYYETLQEKDLRGELSHASILILTANEVETCILHSWMVNGEKKENIMQKIRKITHDDITYFFFQWNAYYIVNIWTGTKGSYTTQGSSWTMRKILKSYRPKLVLSLGVAFGIDWNNQEIGDVIVSQKLYSYDKGIKLVKGRLEVKEEHSFTIHPWLGERLRQKRSFFSEINLDRNFKVQYGDVITGEAVIDDPLARRKILAAINKNIIGGEMEGYGMFSECRNLGIPCAVIKGICDWGVGKNNLDEDPRKNDHIKNGIQAYAMEHVMIACDSLFNDAELFKGSIRQDPMDDLLTRKYTSQSGMIALFYKHRPLFFFCLNYVLVGIVSYRLIMGIHLNVDAIIVEIVMMTLILCLLGFCIILKRNRDAIKQLVIAINTKMGNQSNIEIVQADSDK